MNLLAKFSNHDFYGRQWEQQCLQRALLSGQGVLITAPRRVGKTQLALKLLDWAVENDWQAVYVNVEDAESEADFFDQLAKGLLDAGIRQGLVHQIREAGAKLRNILPRSGKFTNGEQSFEFVLPSETNDALQAAQMTLEQLLESDTGSGAIALLVIDELPIFLTALLKAPNGAFRVEAFLHWFRKIRTKPTLKHIRWLLCGSIGLDAFVEQRRIAGTINDLRPEKLGPFDPQVALEFVQHYAAAGAAPTTISEAVAMRIVDIVGWPLPFYLRLMIDELKSLPPRLGAPKFPAIEDVDAAYEALVSPSKRVQFVHWIGRLELQFGENDLKIVHAILKECCIKPSGVSKSRLRVLMRRHQTHGGAELSERELKVLLSILERDGYLHSVENRWAFRSFLLRDFWRHHATL